MLDRYALLAAVLLCSNVPSWAQAYGELDINDIRFRIFSDGYAGVVQGVSSEPALEVSQGSGTNMLYGSGLWLAGIGPVNDTHTATWFYHNSEGAGADYFPGPLRSDGTASTTATNSESYDHVWVVTRQQIATHLGYFNCLSDPNCDLAVEFPNGYSIPTELAEWPAMGDMADGYDQYLAPFFDFNLDGTYNAEDGDAPCILGDQAFFLVFNDNLAPHGESMGAPFGVEVQVMGFVYQGDDSALDQTVFLRFHLINRSSNTYEDVHLGYFNDIDIGCPEDDFIGTDPSRSMHYVYNWSDYDPCLGYLGDGEQPPAVGMTLIKGPQLDPNGADDPLTNLIPAWNGQGFGDGILDNERHGLSHSIYFNRVSPNNAITDPSQPSHWANYMKGLWKDGTPWTYGGNGYSSSPGAIPARYIFPGTNDPVGAGTEGQIMAPWAETVPTPATPDRRGVLSSGPITFDPGEHIDLLLAYVYARATSGGAIASVGALHARVDSIRAFAQSLPIWNVSEESGFAGQCADYATIGLQEQMGSRTLSLSPSPASMVVNFVAPRELVGGQFTMRDATGRVLYQQRVLPDRNTIDVSALAKGVYLCEAVARYVRYTGRIVKE